ncbi:hypothetical protein [Paraburkholderia youngii]|uniref:hypothetical protein n=1 Tax=Paraburkholderia youngii TaxID=2782701 RepID=UPI003D2011CB
MRTNLKQPPVIAALLAASMQQALAASDDHTVMSQATAASAMKRAIPILGAHGSPYVIDSHGCLWGIGEDRDLGVVGTIRILDESGKQVCRANK